MKDDPDFNIHFVTRIEANPCIYDHTRSDYSNRNIQDLAWEQIAKELKATGKDKLNLKIILLSSLQYCY